MVDKLLTSTGEFTGFLNHQQYIYDDLSRRIPCNICNLRSAKAFVSNRCIYIWQRRFGAAGPNNLPFQEPRKKPSAKSAQNKWKFHFSKIALKKNMGPTWANMLNGFACMKESLSSNWNRWLRYTIPPSHATLWLSLQTNYPRVLKRKAPDSFGKWPFSFHHQQTCKKGTVTSRRGHRKELAQAFLS